MRDMIHKDVITTNYGKQTLAFVFDSLTILEMDTTMMFVRAYYEALQKHPFTQSVINEIQSHFDKKSEKK